MTWVTKDNCSRYSIRRISFKIHKMKI